jgi:hypothetical protein
MRGSGKPIAIPGKRGVACVIEGAVCSRPNIGGVSGLVSGIACLGGAFGFLGLERLSIGKPWAFGRDARFAGTPSCDGTIDVVASLA